ncbi:MAG TPA: hypothetical protein PKD67_12005 [Ignavibacteriaceae bacterium]|nr:hypothetical protein [Ignavibacteriaceae bacterium]
MAKYLITKTDISINGIIHSEGSVIDSTNFSKEDLESVSHLLVPVEKSLVSMRSGPAAVTLNSNTNETPITTNTDSLVTKRNRKPKSTN